MPINSNSIRQAYLRKLESRIEDALNVVGAYVVSKAAYYCPVKTSNLVNSINYATSKTQGGVKGKTNGTPLSKALQNMTVKVGTNVVYAARIEFGFSGTDSLGRSFNQPGTPYLRPAILSHKAGINKIFARAIKEGMVT